MKKIYIIFILFTTLLNAEIDYHFNGFGSIVLSNVDGEDTHSLYIDQKAKVGNGVNIKSGSILGLQNTINYNNKVSAIGQIIFRENIETKIYKPQLEWLFLKTNIVDDLKIRAGRLRIPAYLYSSTYYVDYARPYVKLPYQVYRSMPFSHYDGIELIYTKDINDYIFTTSGGFSKKTSYTAVGTKGSSNLTMESKNLKIITVSLENNDFLLKGVFTTATTSLIDNKIVDSIFNNMRLLGLENVANDYELKDKKIDVYILGFNYYLDDITLNAEWVHRRTKSILTNITAYSLSAVYDLNEKWIPFVYYSKLRNIQKSDNRIENSTNPLIIAKLKPALNLIRGLNGENQSTETYSIGTQYRVNNNISLKFEAKYNKDKYVKENFKMYHLSLDFAF